MRIGLPVCVLAGGAFVVGRCHYRGVAYVSSRGEMRAAILCGSVCSLADAARQTQVSGISVPWSMVDGVSGDQMAAPRPKHTRDDIDTHKKCHKEREHRISARQRLTAGNSWHVGEAETWVVASESRPVDAPLRPRENVVYLARRHTAHPKVAAAPAERPPCPPGKTKMRIRLYTTWRRRVTDLLHKRCDCNYL